MLSRLILAFCILIPFATPALAQPALVASTPAAGTVVARPALITIGFDAPVEIRATSVELTMTSMPGMAAHSPMRMGGYTLAASPDGRTIMLKRKSPLPPGGYTLAWKIARADGTAASGTLSFVAQ